MLKFKSRKGTSNVLALVLACLMVACSAQAPTPSSQASLPHLDELERAASSGSTEDVLALVQYSSLPCTKAEGLGGPPKCLADEAEGTLVEVLPVLDAEGHHIRRSEINSWPGIRGAQLYAAYRASESTSSDENFPTGDFGIAFLLPDQASVVVFQVTQDGIVRIDYHSRPSFDDLLKNREVVLGPNPPSE